VYADSEGRLFERRDETEQILVGSSVERWLDAVVARESLVFDREGEYRDVFEEGELTAAVRRKRTRSARKLDPLSALWALEEAELLLEEGEGSSAEELLRRVVELDRSAADAWALLGALCWSRRASEESERAWRRAAEESRDPERRAERFAGAARAALAQGQEQRRREYSELGCAADPGCLARWRFESEELAAEGDLEGAVERASLGAAVEPEGPCAALLPRLRARRQLRVVDS
jgi:tetratricopeptide (TPR) repeat protein